MYDCVLCMHTIAYIPFASLYLVWTSACLHVGTTRSGIKIVKTPSSFHFRLPGDCVPGYTRVFIDLSVMSILTKWNGATTLFKGLRRLAHSPRTELDSWTGPQLV